MIIENLNQLTQLSAPSVPSFNMFAAGCCDNTEDNGWSSWMEEEDFGP